MLYAANIDQLAIAGLNWACLCIVPSHNSYVNFRYIKSPCKCAKNQCIIKERKFNKNNNLARSTVLTLSEVQRYLSLGLGRLHFNAGLGRSRPPRGRMQMASNKRSCQKKLLQSCAISVEMRRPRAVHRAKPQCMCHFSYI
jgi:hypothetical protein